jgi:hypothetical protein
MGPGLPPGRQKQFALAATSTLDLDLASFTNSEECGRPKSVGTDQRELPMQTPSNPIARVCL